MTTNDASKTLVHCLLHWEKVQPNAVYFTQPYPDGRIVDYTWAEVAGQVRRMATHLKSLNLPPQSNIARLGRNSAHWIMADLACWMAGHVTVPLYPTLNADTASYIIKHCEAKLLLLGKMDGTADGWNEMQHGIPRELPVISLPMSPRKDTPQWEEIIARTQPQELPLPKSDDIATIVYTSGSTGYPKGVVHCFRAMAQVANGVRNLFPVTEQDRMLSYLPLAHVAERAAVESMSLYFGFRVYFANSLDTFIEDLRRARPTLFFSVPRLWTKFYLGINEKLPPSRQKFLFNLPLIGKLIKKKILTQLGLQDVRAAITGAAPLPPDIINWYRGLGLELLEMYGMSENFGYSHANRPGHTRVGYVGNSNPGVECKIGENGEVLVKSPGQMLGYYKNPEKTAEDLTPDGFFKTGDMGEIDEQGRLRITGRVKELFKTSKGKYVAPVPIENRFNHPKVEVVCVAGASQPQPHALAMLSLDAQKELAGGGDRGAFAAELQMLLDKVNAQLDPHEALDFVVVVKEQWTMENGFLTPTMKIKRNVIEKHYEPRTDSWYKARQKVIWE